MSRLTNRLLELSAFRQAILIFALAISIGIGIESSVVSLTKTPVMRPLLNNLSAADAPKVREVLNENKISYRIDLSRKMLYVSIEQSEQAQVALASVGIEVESRGQRR
ncbi:MAG: hypothetical protein HRT35_09975 [Algicola sp.]|nr:hypothetical protein [Algicola sp.]